MALESEDVLMGMQEDFQAMCKSPRRTALGE